MKTTRQDLKCPEISEPFPERSNRRGSESSTLEIDVYVWRYALIVVHARNDDDDDDDDDDNVSSHHSRTVRMDSTFFSLRNLILASPHL